MRLSRLEVRHGGQLPRGAEPAHRPGSPAQDQGQILSGGRARRRGLCLNGRARDSAAIAGVEATVLALRRDLRYLRAARVQLAAGARRRHRHLLGGAMLLDPAAARSVVSGLAEPLGLGLAEAAEGILTIVNANMANAISSRTVQKGLDPRGFALVASGGAGPLHGAEGQSDFDDRRIASAGSDGSTLRNRPHHRERRARRARKHRGRDGLQADADVLFLDHPRILKISAQRWSMPRAAGSPNWRSRRRCNRGLSPVTSAAS